MSRDGAVTLLDYIHAGEARIEIACRKCDRRGSYNVQRLYERVGDIKMTDFLWDVCEDCPRRQPVRVVDYCGAYYVNPLG